MFTTEFDQYVCPGDTIRCEVDGVVYTARLAYDMQSRPQDFDNYTEAEINAWSQDEWSFFGLSISASKNGIALGDHMASLWGIEANFGDAPGRNRYFLEVANNLLGEAQQAAKEVIQSMLIALAA